VSGADEHGRIELHRVDPAAPGLRRVRRGKGFQYLSAEGDTIDDPIELARIKSLAVPPAWRDVWICPDPAGHIQAVGTDAAGRRQYRYHDQWRAERDREKFDRVLRLAGRLAEIRTEVAARLDERGLRRPRVLSGALRMLELGAFRVGGDEYAPGGNLATGDDVEGSFGLATLRREHVRRIRGEVRIAYPAKGGVWRELALRDKQVHQLVGALLRRRAGEAGEDLLVYRLGRGWHDVRSEDVNDYLKELAGDEFTAKDLRTWNATVLAAAALAGVNPDQLRTKRGRKRALTDSYREVAEHLGNTPTVAKQSYIDPRVIAAFEHGRTVAAAVRRAAAQSGGSPERTRDVIEPAVIRLLSQE
jgi:DNA topoisomerase IB